MDNHNWDLIVVGSGLCGLASAITAQGKGLKVLLVEKRDIPGDGFHIDELVYPHALKQILSDYENLDAILTPIKRRGFWIATETGHTALEAVTSPDDSGTSGFIADRPKLDYALFDRFIALGGELRPNYNAAELLFDDSGAVIGIKNVADEDDEYSESFEYFAPLTIFADGPDSQFANQLLKRDELNLKDKIIVVKETLIGEDNEPSIRMTGTGETAASIVVLGDPLDIGFSWARLMAFGNKLVLKAYIPADLVSDNQNVNVFIEQLKTHPSIEPIVRGFESESINTQTIPIAGFEMHPDLLWGDGYLITGKAARIYHPFDCRMSDYSIVSGTLAANAAVNAVSDRRASQAHDFPLAISESFLLKDRRSMSDLMNEIRNKKNFSKAYPQVMFEILTGIFTMDSRSKGMKKKEMERSIRSQCSVWSTLSDIQQLFKLYG